MHLKRKILIPLLSILILVFALAFVSACAGTEVVPNPDGGSQTEQGGGQGGSQGGGQGGGGSQTPSKNVYDMSAVEFSDVTVPYDGEPHSIQIGGTLPAGVSVSYDGNGKVDAGTYTITAHFTGDSKNYQSIPDKTATLTIEKADYDMTGITFDGATVTYDGNTHPLAIKGNLPAGVNVSYENNSQTTAGAHEVVAHFTGDTKNHNAIPDKKATLTIEKADYDMTGITFDGATVTYDGNPHPLAIKGNLPAGVHVTYDNNNQTTVGHHVVVAHFTGDTQNHNTIPDKQAILIIQQATVAGITFEDETFTYNGEVHSIFIKGDLPDGVNVRYENNGQIDAGEYQVKAIFDTGENYKPIAVMAAKLVIEKADYDMKGITFEGLTVTYDGNPHPLAIKGQLPTDVHVTYDNNDQTTAGEHKVVAHFTGDTQNHNLISDKEATLVIEKATYDMKGITFEGLTVPYDGKTHPLAIQGQLPKDVNVSYENNNQTTAGEHIVIAHFTGDATNYNEIEDMKATLTIEKIDYDMNGITFPNKTVTYDKQPHPLAVEGNLPQGVYVSYENNSQITAGEHTVTARFTGDANHNKIPDMKATLTIEKATYAMEGITFEGLTVTYDGNTHPLAIQGQLPKDVSVSYENNNRTTAGRHEVIAHFTGDKTNYNKIDDMKATLIIEKADYDLSKVTFEDLTVTYDGNTHPLAIKGDLPDGVSVVYENNEQTDAGRYTVTARFTGKDTVNHNLIPAKEATLIIEKADYDLSGITFEDDTLPYDGEAHSILISGDLPTDVSVAYDGNAMVNAGDYTITAHFTGKDTTNHNLIPDKTATLHIKKLTYDLGDVTFSGEIYTYDKIWHEITIKGTLPQGITVSYEDNKQINAGTYTAIAHFSGKDTVNHELIPDKYATLFIAKRDLTVKITGETTIKYDGNEHKDYHAEVSGMIGDDTVETVLKYSGNMIDKGTYTVTATIANSQNYRLNKNNTLTVTITRETHTVTFKQRNQPNQTVQVLDLAGISDDEMPKPVDVLGYHIAWEEVDLSCITSDMTVNAIENIITYTITYYLNGGTNAEKNPQSYQVTDLTIELADATREKDESLRAGEYLFGGWFLDAQFTLPITKITTEICAQYGNLELYANFVVGTRGVTYEKIDENSYRVTGYSGSDSEVVISSFWKFKPVKEIKSSAFQNRTGIISVTIPESITTIGDSAFEGCTSLATVYWNATNCTKAGSYTSFYSDYTIFKGCTALTTVYIGENVESIPEYAFYNCTSLVSVDFAGNSSLASIGKNAFNNCTSLASITMPESVTSIGDRAFYNCTSLESIDFGDNSSLTSIGGSAFNNCTRLASITMPESVTSIGDYAFSSCESLESVDFGDNSSLASIGNYAFEDCTSLVSITMPESVTSIGNYAFYKCTSLESITIPESVTSIGWNAFEGCTSLATVYWNATNCTRAGSGGSSSTIFTGCTALTTVHIGENVESIPAYAFEYYTGLASVDFGDNSSLVSIGECAFAYCTSLESVTIPESVTSIGGSAFYHCTSLRSVDFGDNSSLTSIGGSAFSDCTSLASITIPESVTSVGAWAFAYCESLESVTIPESLTSIGARVFEDCTNIKTVTMPTSAIGSIPKSGLQTVILTSGDSIGDEAFRDCTRLESITMPESVTSIGSSAFYNCTSLESIIIHDGVTSIGNEAFYHCTSLPSIFIIPESVTSIGARVFEGCSGIETVLFSGKSNLETIGDGAFKGCTSLESITIPESVTSIGQYAFSGCTSLAMVYWNATNCDTAGSDINPIFEGCTALTTVHIGKNVDSIPDKAFYKCTSLESVDFGANSFLTSIGNYAFDGCTSLESITIPESVTSIGEWVFAYCKSLESVTIPESVASIGGSAFDNCTSLASVDFGDNSSLASIGNYAFRGCTRLESITIPESVTSIGNYAFDGCTSLASITIPESVTSIGYYAFSGCKSLESITMPESVTSIDNYAFASCTNLATVYWNATNCTKAGSFDSYFYYYIFNSCTALTTVHIGENVEGIPAYAFGGCTSLATVYWNATNCKTAGSYDHLIFSGCTALTTVHIGKNVKRIPASAFSGCTSLESVYITNLKAWCEIDFGGSSANPLSNGAALYLNGAPVTDLNGFSEITEIKQYAFTGCTSFENITIPESVTSVGNYAFYNCTSLESITIPESVTSIGGSAFYGCPITTATMPTSVIGSIPKSSLQTVILTSGDSIGNSAFYGYTSLVSITIPESVTSIGNDAFYQCTSLVSVDFGDNSSLTSIGRYAFSGCTSFENITIPESVTSVGNYAFSGCTSLESITIPESVTSISDYAFSGCTSLESITIPESVTSIGNYAFNGCPITTATMPTSAIGKIPKSSLQTVILTSGDTIGYRAFSGCTSLESITIPESVTSIDDEAFRYCTNLESVDFGDNSSLTSIDWYAFSGCTSLASITIPESVTSIGNEAFYNCTSLESITIPESVTSIGGSAFYGCPITTATMPTSVIGSIPKSSLQAVILTSGDTIGEKAFYNCTSLESITIPESVTSIGDEAFRYCTNLESITIPESVTSIGDWAFYSCTRLETVYWNATNCTKAGSSYVPIFEDCTALTTVYIGENVEGIPASAFYNCTSLESVYITNIKAWCAIDFGGSSANPLSNGAALYLNKAPVTDLNGFSEITEIKNYTFSGCTSLASITIPDSVTSIGACAFYKCTSLESITIPDSVTSIGNYAFSGCTSLASITIPDSVASIGIYTFYGCTSLASITIPDSVASIGNYAFYGCANLASITIPDSVASIGNYAFYGCANLASVDFGNKSSLTSIDGWAFYGCKSLVSVDFGANSVLASIGERTFYGCASLESITIPESVISIGGWAFYYCTRLATVYWNATNCTKAGSESYPIFRGCTALTTVYIGENVESIPQYAFYGCTALTTVYIGENVESIPNYTFRDCTSLANVYYGGNPTQWGRISIGTNNSNLINAARYYYSEGTPSAEQWAKSENWWHYDPDTGEIQIWKKES